MKTQNGMTISALVIVMLPNPLNRHPAFLGAVLPGHGYVCSMDVVSGLLVLPIPDVYWESQ